MAMVHVGNRQVGPLYNGHCHNAEVSLMITDRGQVALVQVTILGQLLYEF